jgi:putative Holliday junction resolvase
MGRIMALDVGDVRIGVAVSDIMGIIANPLLTYTRTKDEAADIAYLTSLAKEKEVDLIVSGLPLSLSGADSIQTGKVRDFVAKVAQFSGLDTKFVDERLTTAAAERVLIEGNVRRENRKKYIDKVAATIILQTYLDYYKR